MSTLTRNRELTKYMDGVMDECLANIPLTQRTVDLTKAAALPHTWVLKTGYEPTLNLACKARRSGAESRAEAIEWAFDSLIRGNGMKRVGEVYLIPVNELQNGEVVEVRYFQALVRERDENE